MDEELVFVFDHCWNGLRPCNPDLNGGIARCINLAFSTPSPWWQLIRGNKTVARSANMYLFWHSIID